MDPLKANPLKSVLDWKCLDKAPLLLDAARDVLWKLNHNYDEPSYKGPARITRDDATIKMLAKIVAEIED